MTKKIAIHQSQYLPWPPYLKKIALADEFVWMDCVQFQRHGVQNRNKIRNSSESFWLTIPVSGHLGDHIKDMRISKQMWKRKHWVGIECCYAKSPFWGSYKNQLQTLYEQDYQNLDEVNWAFVRFFMQVLDINTPMLRLSELEVSGQKSELILNICKARGAGCYLSGFGAQDYLDQAAFDAAGIAIEYLASEPPEYRQFHGDFIAGLSTLDMLFNLDIDIIKRFITQV